MKREQREQREQRRKPARGAPSRFSLANWPVSVRLAALVVIASLIGLVFGGLRIAGAAGEASAYGRTTQLAVLSGQVSALAQAMEDERDLAAGVAALATLSQAAVSDQAGPQVVAQLSRAMAEEQASLTAARRTTDSAAGLTVARASGVGPGFPSSLQDTAGSVIAQARNLTELRAMVAGQRPAAVIDGYSGALADLFALNDQVTSTSGDTQLTGEARTLSAMSRAKDQASQQRAILDVALIESGLSDAGSGQRGTADPTGKPYNNITGTAALRAAGGMQALIIARSLQLTDVLSFQSAATAAQESAYLAVTASPQVVAALRISTLVTATGDPRAIERSSLGVTAATAPGVWYRDMSTMIGGMRAIESAAAGALVTRSELRQHQAAESALLAAVVTVAAVLLTLLATALVGRSLLRPLRRLQADALEIATVRLPSRVTAAATGRDLGQSAGGDVEPIGVRSTDEIGKVARAFDQVHAEAVRLASTEAQLRGNLNSMFISLSRRSVPLIERLARMIDSLEQNEDDPDQLANLFAMDHMVTRMRRNSENLLVLGGEEPVRKWSGPVPLSDVTHAAAAEIEQYNRVMLTVQPGVVVSGQAAADIVHLLAELIENATLFSPRETQVHVSAREMGRGGVAIEVRDEGVGVSASRLADMNWRLDHPPVIDVSVSRHMGLFAVSRLAARHGIRVRLRTGAPQGLSVLIWLPSSITRPEPSPQAGPHSRRPAHTPAPGDPLAASRHSAGKHRLGLLGSTGDQPALADQAAVADSATVADMPAVTESPDANDQVTVAGSPTLTGSPAVAGQRARSTTAWFAAKAPSGRSALPQDPSPRRMSAQAGLQVQAALPETPAGLPRRVPRAVRDVAPALSAPVLTPSQGGPRSGPETGPEAALRQGAFPQGAFPRPAFPDAAFPGAGVPRRRSPEAARSRLAGFQLGSREAREDSEAAGDREAREAEHEPD